MITKLIKPKYTRQEIENAIKDYVNLYPFTKGKFIKGEFALLACELALVIGSISSYALSLVIMNENSVHIQDFLNFTPGYHGIIASSGSLIWLGKYLTFMIIMFGFPLIIAIFISKTSSLIIKKVFKKTISQKDERYEKNASIRLSLKKLIDMKNNSVWETIEKLEEILNKDKSIEIVCFDQLNYIKYIDDGIVKHISISNEVLERVYKNSDTLDFSFVDKEVEEILQDNNINEENSIIQGGYYGKRLH